MRALAGAMIMMAAAATPVVAQQESVTERWSVELDAAFFGEYDDSGLWGSGAGGGITGWWALNTTTYLGAHFSVTQWSYESSSVVSDLVPPGSELRSEESTGHVQLVSLTPLIRYQREEVMGTLGAFAAAGGGVAYLRQHALTDVTFFPPSVGAASFELDDSSWNASIEMLAGLRLPVSSSSWLELISSYRALFADETANLVGIGVGFHVRV